MLAYILSQPNNLVRSETARSAGSSRSVHDEPAPDPHLTHTLDPHARWVVRAHLQLVIRMWPVALSRPSSQPIVVDSPGCVKQCHARVNRVPEHVSSWQISYYWMAVQDGNRRRKHSNANTSPLRTFCFVKEYNMQCFSADMQTFHVL